MSVKNKISALILALGISSCVQAPPPYYQCPPLAIDTARPDFLQHYDYTVLSNFYTCTSRNLDIDNSRTLFGYKPLPPAPAGVDPAYTSLAYQWNLWQQIHAQELKPLAAQQAWIEFSSAKTAQRAQVRAAEAAEAAADRADTATQALLDRQNRRHRQH